MNAQDIINEIQTETENFKSYRQNKPKGLSLEVIKSLTPEKIKSHQEFFNIQDEQEQADYNISLLFRIKPKQKKLIKEIFGE